MLKQLENGIRSVSRNNPIERPYTEKEIEDKKHLISILDERLSGKKRKKVSKNSQGEVEDEWVIEIYSMKFGYFKKKKNSERRKK